MRFWVDTEFVEDGRTIDLISIGIVAEDGRELYLGNRECDFPKASQWVRENVFPLLGLHFGDDGKLKRFDTDLPADFWRTKEAIALEVVKFFGGESIILVQEFEPAPALFSAMFGQVTHRLLPDTPTPEIWAYYADYDWVALCQLFGTMMQLPEGFPMYCRDIKQECDRLGNPDLPPQDDEHDALADARWNKKAWEYLANLEQQ